jgi:acyl carrier protein
MKSLEALIESIFDEDLADVLRVAHFRELRSWDSLRHVRLIVSLQTQFHRELSAEEIAKLTSVSAIKQVLATR